MSIDQDFILQRIDDATYRYCLSCGADEDTIIQCLKAGDAYGWSQDETVSELRKAVYNLQTDNIRANLIKTVNRNGEQIKAVISNFLSIMERDPYFSGVKYNTVSYSPEIWENGNVRIWGDADDAKALSYIEDRFDLFNDKKFFSAFRIFCENRSYDPIVSAIERTQWDGVPRVSEFLIKWLGATDNAYSRECSRLLFASGVNRAYVAGSKVDAVIVLIGKQGSGKSTICNWLALDDRLFASANTSISGQAGSEICEGKWVVELEELISTSDPKRQDEVKAYISRTKEHYRKPYDRHTADYPRHNFFIGTTNRLEFLSDTTGNRRWFPLPVNSTAEYLYQHETEVKADIAQCWAEMATAYKIQSDFSKPVERKDITAYAERMREKSSVTDDDIGIIQAFLIDHDEVKTVCCLQIWKEVLHDAAFDVPLPKADSIRIANILTDVLKWERGEKSKRIGKYGVQRVFKRPQFDEKTSKAAEAAELPFLDP